MLVVVLVIVMIVLAALMLHLREPKENSRSLAELLPVYKIERDCLLSRQGDMTVVFKVELPEIFTLSNDEYEALHHIWVKALKILPAHTVLHKQDYFVDAKYSADFSKEHTFLSHSSEHFFHERPYLDHTCYIMITRKAGNRKPASSVFSNLLKPSLVPSQNVQELPYQEFTEKVGQFSKLLSEGGYIQLQRLTGDELAGTPEKAGLLERYCFLLHEQEPPLTRNIIFKPEWQIGEHYCQLYAISDVEDLPALCGPRLTYDRYSTDKTKFSIGFASPVGQLLPCNHIYNQFIEIQDVQKTIKKLEAKRRRLQSLSAYSRENAIGREATNAFLNEAISQQRLPVKAHFNIMVWSDNRDALKELRNKASAALAQMDASPRQEIKGAPQLFWAAMPGNAADLPQNECFDTFAEQASCFFNQETGYRSSVSPFGIRLGERLSGKPVLVDISDEPMKMGICTNRNKFILGPSGGCRAIFK